MQLLKQFIILAKNVTTFAFFFMLAAPKLPSVNQSGHAYQISFSVTLVWAGFTETKKYFFFHISCDVLHVISLTNLSPCFLRDAILDESGAAESPITSLNSSKQDQLRTRSWPTHQTETLDWLVRPTQGSVSDKYDSNVRGILETIPLETAITSRAEGSIIDLWKGISTGSQPSDHSI